jgi:DNA processing protein
MAGGIRLSDNQLIDWLRLIRTDGVGPRTFQSLLNHFGSAAAAVEGLPELSLRKSGRRTEVYAAQAAERELEAVKRMGAVLLPRGDDRYPVRLANIDSAPPLITAIGKLDMLNRPAVAIVGSRNASFAGLRMAEQLSTGLGRQGYVVVSGLARGIDTSAHTASLASGTIAVLAGGLDKPYPDENRRLFDQLCKDGVVVAEMPVGWEPRGRDFPRRNRIISGLSLGVVVVEAALKSGSLITSRFALEQGREVFAVPGSPLDPRAEGPNQLIRNGATLVRNADDIHEDLEPILGRDQGELGIEDSGNATASRTPLWDEFDWLDDGTTAPAISEQQPYDGWEEQAGHQTSKKIRNLLSSAPMDPDDIARLAGLPIRDVQLALFDLDNEGVLERVAGGKVSLKMAAE